MRWFHLALILSCTTACAGYRDAYLRREAAGDLACDPASVTVRIVENLSPFGCMAPSQGVTKWAAAGCEREVLCWNYDTSGTRCEETESSKARTSWRLALDRLALESGCPQDQIALVAQSEWVHGGERSYRMTACDHRLFVCTVAPGRADCKLAERPTP